MTVHEVADAALGNTSYVIDLGGGVAAVVDPRRDVDDYLAVAGRLGLRVVASIETHLHADFVTGTLELSAATSAEVVAPAAGEAAFEHRGMTDGDSVAWGDAEIRAIGTPGHTPEHLAYLMVRDGDPVGVFTGGSLIAGGAARTDLISADLTEELAREQFRSLRRLATLPDHTVVWPTHGAGSFCSAGPAGGGATTVGAELRGNPLFGLDDEDEFVRVLTGGYGSFPPYFLRLRDLNRRGPGLAADLDAPKPLSPAAVAEMVSDGAWLIDVRSLEEWARAHPRGAISNALRPAFASWLGWIVPFGSKVVLVADEGQVAEAVMLARRIGYDAVVGWVDGGVEAWRAAGLPVDAVETVGPEGARSRLDSGAMLLDVRQRSEVAAARIPGSTHLELGDLVAGKIPDGDDVVVYCGHGERSATGASLLERRGVRVANLAGGLPAWESAGFPVER